MLKKWKTCWESNLKNAEKTEKCWKQLLNNAEQNWQKCWKKTWHNTRPPKQLHWFRIILEKLATIQYTHTSQGSTLTRKENTVLSRVSPPSVRERSLQILRQYKRFFPFFNQWIGWREHSCWITCFICHQIWKRPAIFPWNQFGDCTSSSSCFHAVFVFTAHKA